MKRFWTADLHFGHANVANYCKRPSFRQSELNADGTYISPEIALAAAARMDDCLIKLFNARVKPEDSVIHVGDFMNRGVCRGVPGLRNNPENYLKLLNGSWTLLEGNHDANNKVKAIGQYLIAKIGRYRALVTHYPTYSHESQQYDRELIRWAASCCNFAIVGHVHEKWDVAWDTVTNYQKPFLNINVGVDVRKWVPLLDEDVITIADRAFRDARLKSAANGD